jgi:hypothetical protein
MQTDKMTQLKQDGLTSATCLALHSIMLTLSMTGETSLADGTASQKEMNLFSIMRVYK